MPPWLSRQEIADEAAADVPRPGRDRSAERRILDLSAVDKGRVEAFSDGVLAVAITLLVLDLKFDTGAHHASLAHQLSNDWPAFAAFGVSFFQIGVIWVNHHALLSAAARLDRVSMFYNLLLLMFVCTIPFTTATYAGLLRSGGSDERIAVLLYGASMIGMSIGFTLLLGRLVTKQSARSGR